MKETTLCYLEKDNKYLMLYRNKRKDDPNYGKWIGIGGKLEPGETHRCAAIREIWEETGLKVSRCIYKGEIRFISDFCEDEIMHLYYSDSFTGNLKECSEGELMWVEKDKLDKLPMWEGDKIFLNLLNKDIPVFSLILEYEQDRLKAAVLNGEKIKI